MTRLKRTPSHDPLAGPSTAPDEAITLPAASANPAHQLQHRLISSFGPAALHGSTAQDDRLATHLERGIELFSRMIGVVLFAAVLVGVVALLV